MGTRLGASPRFPSTHAEAWAKAYGQLQSTFDALCRGHIDMMAATEILTVIERERVEDIDRIVAEACGSPTAWENVGSSRL